MTWRERLNWWALRWFFVRLARVRDDEAKPIGWTVLRWVYPLSGWDGRPYRFVGAPRGKR